MITYKDFRKVSFYAAAFTHPHYPGKSEIIGKLLNKYGDVFGGDLISIPVPDDAPLEIPRITLMSEDKSLTFEIAFSRINLSMNVGQYNEPNQNHEDFLNLVKNLFIEYKSISGAVYGRLACMLDRFFETDNPAKTLATYFCKDELINEPLKRPMNFEIHAYKCYRVNDQFSEVNSWIRHKIVDRNSRNNAEIIRGIVVHQDLNTPQKLTMETDYNDEAINMFYDVIPIEMDSILKLYYP